MAVDAKSLPMSHEDAIAAEEEAIRREWPHLLEEHEGEFVAFYQGKLVDHDGDEIKMVERLFKTIGYVPFCVTRVERIPTIDELPSPELII